jgi:hypothetical protein
MTKLPGLNDLRITYHEHNGVAIKVMRGLVDNQFIRNRYTLMVETQVDDRDTRKCCWEFGNGEPPRFMGYTSGSEVVARLAGELKPVAE